MRPLDSLPDCIRQSYEVHEWRHASAVLQGDFPEQWDDILAVLSAFELRRSYIGVSGGNRSAVARWFDRAFRERGWRERKFKTQIVVDEHRIDSPTHKSLS